jgi:aminoglycoside phosphotransferase
VWADGPDEVVAPPPVLALAAGLPPRAVWQNELGGLTFELPAGDRRSFVKWVPAGSRQDLDREATRLRWAGRYVAVPRVLAQGADDTGRWLVTAGLPGDNAATPTWKARPAEAAAAIGRGLRSLHDALPVDGCPFSWRAEDRLAVARRMAAAGEQDPSRWDDTHRPLTVEEALARLADPPAVDRLVVCHGDACAPNTLLLPDGTVSGHVDLGSLGVADRWADLAVATWSLNWNYGPGWEPTLLDAYGLDADPDRTAYYRLLWDLGP